MSKFKFSEGQKANVKAAIEDLESHSSGEIVPYFARRSDDYDEVKWKAALFVGLFGAGVLGLSSYFWLLPFAVTPLEDAIYITVLMSIGFIIPVIIPSSIRYLVSDSKLEQRVRESAVSVFLEEEIFNTRDRTGVLIYISELEHKVMVIADAGINKKVNHQDWKRVAEFVVEGVKKKEIDRGLIKAIVECKELLIKNGFTVRDDDTNELSDDLRIG